MTDTASQEKYSEPPWVTAENKLKQTFYRPNIDEKVTPMVCPSIVDMWFSISY